MIKHKEQIIRNEPKCFASKCNQGCLIKNREYKPDYNQLILCELTKLENLSLNYTQELKILSKDIRRFLWYNCNSYLLYSVLYNLNKIYKIIFEKVEYENVDLIIEYILHISRHIYVYNEIDVFEKMQDDVCLANAKVIINEKWENVFKSNDGIKSFIELFDDIFTNLIEKYENPFIIKLSKKDVLCRMVKEKECNEKRFIPWPNKTLNRWNPPGKTYLYLSYGKDEVKYNDDLTLGEYICLLECRTKLGEDCCFARFEATTEGRILDLSYNDVTLEYYRKQISNYEKEIEQTILNKLINDTDLVQKAKLLGKSKTKQFVMNRINDIYKFEYCPNIKLNNNITSQILKMICQSIYTKVDEESDEEKERAYKSFHLLSEYLESKGITGIIYPCTRTNKIVGKNIVLFNIKDAVPINGSIKKYHYIE